MKGREAMSDLVSEIRAEHVCSDVPGDNSCVICSAGRWDVKLPCDAIRLADALEAAEARATAAKSEKDIAYRERNLMVRALASLYPSGIRRTAIEGWSDDWQGCVYIDLPTGQASWHYHDSEAAMFADLPPYTKPWDGHSTPEKYERLVATRGAAEAERDTLRTRCERMEGLIRKHLAKLRTAPVLTEQAMCELLTELDAAKEPTRE